MAGAPPVFGALEQLITTLNESQARAQSAKQIFSLRLKAEKTRQENEIAGLKAKRQSEAAQAKVDAQGANAPATQEPATAGFEQIPLGAVASSGAPSPTLNGVLSALGTQGSVNGGAAVQSVLKGGGTPGAVGAANAQADPLAGVSAPATRTQTTLNEGSQQIDTGTYGIVTRPTVSRTTTTEDNVLTPAQVLQAKLQQADSARQQANADRDYELDNRIKSAQLASQEKEANARIRIADAANLRGERREKFDLANEVLKTVPGINGATAERAVGQALKGDTEGYIKTLGPDLERLNVFDAKVREYRLEKERLENEKTKADLGLTGARTLKTLADYDPDGLAEKRRAGGKLEFTPAQAAGLTSKLFDRDGAFKPSEEANLRRLQTYELDRNRLLLIDEGGVLADEKTVLIDNPDIVTAIGDLATGGPNAQAAKAALLGVRTPNGSPVFDIREAGDTIELVPAVSPDDRNYNGIDRFIDAAAARARESAAPAPADPAAKTPLTELRDSITETEQAMAAIDAANPRTGYGGYSKETLEAFRQRGKLQLQLDDMRKKLAVEEAKLKAADKARSTVQRTIDAQAALLEAQTRERLNAIRAGSQGAP